ncbi:MAG: RHS repeat-associated core domain-containing protein [Chloroflexi bacterium]|nr:RHS repeat-associated core domain-containing protein [Chloroflexota bacterium]MBU1746574.1 RHS repeat-associated core domain-containing protein [Chloroflexota bacterium]
MALYDYGARFYDPLLGRFISADTIVPEPGNPQALNRYSYCVGNPIRYTDPTGHRYDPGGAYGKKEEDPPPPPQPSGPTDLNTYAKMPYEDHFVRYLYAAYTDPWWVGLNSDADIEAGRRAAARGYAPVIWGSKYPCYPWGCKKPAPGEVSVDDVKGVLGERARKGLGNYCIGSSPGCLSIEIQGDDIEGSSTWAAAWYKNNNHNRIMSAFVDSLFGASGGGENYESLWLETLIEAHPQQFTRAVNQWFVVILYDIYQEASQ